MAPAAITAALGGVLAGAARAVCLGLAASIVGLAIGDARVAAIDAGALDLAPGRHVVAVGHVAVVPRREAGEVEFELATADGRALVEAHEPVGELSPGQVVRVRGVIRDPESWRDDLVRAGIRDLLAARSVVVTERSRGGLGGELDRIRERAEAALEHGTRPRAASLLRGFVLGQDDRLDAETIEQFRRSGLAHLLAVSGQNIVLLALLAGAVLAVLDVPLRARLGWILAMIAIYVPVAGAGPSIQRAGVMGAVGVVAALASRPRSRWYALLLAAAVTLGLDPRASGDVGWQLSFAAVVGILLWSRPIATLLGGRRSAPAWKGALVEGAAVTIAATAATTPLMAHHFEAVSLVTLVANLLALPAVAPVMWLGMLAGAAGQLSWLPAEPLTWLAGLLAAYIAQVAEWLAAPSWAQAGVELDAQDALAAYAALAVAVFVCGRWAGRRRSLRPPSRGLWLAATALVALVAASALLGRAGPVPGAEPALRLTVLDVGQGDAILLEPADGDPVLVDAGAREAGVAELVRERGIERLAAVVATHAQSDHVGGVPELLERIPTRRLVRAAPDRRLAADAAAAGVGVAAVAAGDVVRSGSLRLEVLWPPSALLGGSGGRAGDDPNRLSIVIIARWRGFEALLAGDAEAELAALDPGPVDLLKVAHHGSADPGLDALLDRTAPRLALISVGEGNPYGHPAPSTLAELGAHRVPVLRTDRVGEITIEVFRHGWAIG